MEQRARTPTGSWVDCGGWMTVLLGGRTNLRMCGPTGYTPQYTEERRKATGVGHWCRAALVLCRMRRGVVRITLRGIAAAAVHPRPPGGEKRNQGLWCGP
ncbi:hypothetical protein NDU88_006550 [Pleurodeles waltl]|uniref:Uncharacterized protein n=1 Tax=Pleurodeles waltl TaxID=8319 RepID=A0AAV7MDL3_PLEWA|nr:hypothetical protein NDU88_006550 [Pleurodeles waltl]